VLPFAAQLHERRSSRIAHVRLRGAVLVDQLTAGATDLHARQENDDGPGDGNMKPPGSRRSTFSSPPIPEYRTDVSCIVISGGSNGCRMPTIFTPFLVHGIVAAGSVGPTPDNARVEWSTKITIT
jgi:hypothetical protein